MQSDKDYYRSLFFTPLDSLLKHTDKDSVDLLLGSFACNANKDLEDFLRNPNKAILLESKAITRTYLYIADPDTNPIIVAYFALSLSVLDTDGLSKSKIQKLDGISRNRKNIACYLIAQLGKKTGCDHKIGQFVLEDAISIARESSLMVGGRFIVLDAVNNQKVLDFYTSSPNVFTQVATASQDSDCIKMIYPLF